MGEFIGCEECLVIIRWSTGIQLTYHQIWRLTYVGIKRIQQQVDIQSYLSLDGGLRNNNCITMTYITKLDGYELILDMDKPSTTLLMKSAFVYLY